VNPELLDRGNCNFQQQLVAQAARLAVILTILTYALRQLVLLEQTCLLKQCYQVISRLMSCHATLLMPTYIDAMLP